MMTNVSGKDRLGCMVEFAFADQLQLSMQGVAISRTVGLAIGGTKVRISSEFRSEIHSTVVRGDIASTIFHFFWKCVIGTEGV